MRMLRTLSLGLVVARRDRGVAFERRPGGRGALDADAGNWRMIVLTGPTQIAVPAPAQTSSADYQAELAAIKNAQSRLTAGAAEERRLLGRRRRHPVERDPHRASCRAINLPPAPNPDGTYPVPDANNPFADPNFPFANPPYAARAYSYVTVAQFEALKAAWYYKYLYNRPSPARQDSGIKALMPVTDLPAYPSEDAVMSGVNAEMMKLLFPASVEEITLKAGEQRQAALLSGRATASDIAAGLALGQAVAAVFVARAGGDGMRTAGGSPALWQSLADRATARGEIPGRAWTVLPRPPMLPAFGSVRAWMMTPEDIVNERPAPPPSTSSELMAREVAEVRHYVDHGTPSGAGDRQQVGRRSQYARASRPLELSRAPVHPQGRIQRSPGRTRPRAAEHGAARRRGGMLGDEVLLLQPASLSHGPGPQVGHRSSELPLVHLRALDLLGRRGPGAVVPLPERRGLLRGAEGRSVDLPALRRHSLSLRPRGRQGPWEANRLVHRQICDDRRGGRSLSLAQEELLAVLDTR